MVMVFNCIHNNINAFKEEKMKYDLDSGEKKEYKEMTIEEKKEVNKKMVQGALIFAGVLGGIHLLDKL